MKPPMIGQRLKSMALPLAIVAVAYYGLPLLMRLNTGLGFIMLLAVMPLITIFAGALDGARNGLNPWFAISVAALFAPTVFLYYNSSAAFYIGGYALMAMLGSVIGTALRGPQIA